MTLAGIQQRYADGDTPSMLIAEICMKIKGWNDPALFIHQPEDDELLELAAQVEAMPRDLPLWGIPFAVKDNIDVTGIETTCACPGFAYSPSQSATVVRRLEAAGASLIGKTNLDQFATGLVGTRSPYGAAPRRPSRSASSPLRWGPTRPGPAACRPASAIWSA